MQPWYDGDAIFGFVPVPHSPFVCLVAPSCPHSDASCLFLCGQCLDTNEWEEIRATNPPSARYCHTANLYKNQLMIVFGGLGDGGERFNDLCVLDLATQEWSRPVTAGVVPEPRSHHGTVLYGDKLIVFGGLSGLSAERLNSIHILDLEKRPWTWTHPTTFNGTTPPSGRLYPTLAVWKNQLIVFAGYTGKLRLNDMHFLDLATMRWSEPWTRCGGSPADRPSPVYGHSGTQIGSKLVIFGGNTGVSYYENHVYLFDFETMLWRRVAELDCPTGRRYHTALLSNRSQKLYVYGGSTVAKVAEDFLYALDTTLIPGLEEWTFDEAQLLIKAGIRVLANSLARNPKSTDSASSAPVPTTPHAHHGTSTPTGIPVPSSSSPLSFGSSTDAMPASPSSKSRDKSIKVSASSSAALSSSPGSSSATSGSPSFTTPIGAGGSGSGLLRKRKKSKGADEDRSSITHAVPSPAPSSSGPASSSNGDYVIDATAEEQAMEAVRLLKLHFKRLKREREELRAATEELQEAQRHFNEVTARATQYVAQHEGDNAIVKLNVGGTHFETTLVTLTSTSDSMLAAMFSGRFTLPNDREGRVFIDRDGKRFRYILNFLRDGTLNVPADDHVLLLDILQEAQYYQLHKLVQLVKTYLREFSAPAPPMTARPTSPSSSINMPGPMASHNRTRLSLAHRALSMSELRGGVVEPPRTGTSPDFDDYWGNL